MHTQRTPRNVVAVIGTTGVGKSQFAIDLALSLQAHSIPIPGPVSSSPDRTSCSGYTKAKVLSADSMQLYRGLPLITNKVTQEEMNGVDHWGLDTIEPGEGGSWEIGRWCQEAGREIEAMPEDCLPIICGGTHYYTQHFLFPPSSLSQSRSSSTSSNPQEKSSKLSGGRWGPPCPMPDLPAEFDQTLLPFLETFHLPDPSYPSWVSSSSSASEPNPSSNVSSSTNATMRAQAKSKSPNDKSSDQLLALWKLLEAIEPAEAGRWHWRDGRKVKRGIERWWERGMLREEDTADRPVAKESGCLAEHREGADTSAAHPEDSVDGRARFRTLIFWVYDDMERISPRLDKRVDKMVEMGLLEEIRELRNRAKEIYGEDEDVDYQEGIFQSIGYKEFAAIPTASLSPDHPLLAPALERMKLSTRQYAKSQLKWIRKQLLPAVLQARRISKDEGVNANLIEVFVVRGGEVDVIAGQQILQTFLAGSSLPAPEDIGHPQANALLSSLHGPTDEINVLDISGRQIVNARHVCDICSTPGNPVTIIQSAWAAHLVSKGHRRLKGREGDAEREERIARLRAEATQRKMVAKAG